MPFDPYDSITIANMLRKMNYFIGLGLGKRQQRIPEFPHFPSTEHHFGLGYEPTDKDLVELKAEMS